MKIFLVFFWEERELLSIIYADTKLSKTDESRIRKRKCIFYYEHVDENIPD